MGITKGNNVAIEQYWCASWTSSLQVEVKPQPDHRPEQGARREKQATGVSLSARCMAHWGHQTYYPAPFLFHTARTSATQRISPARIKVPISRVLPSREKAKRAAASVRS